MIDLRKNKLPDTIEVDGSLFKVKTDFRQWIQFGEILKNEKATIIDLAFILENVSELDLILKQEEFTKALLGFYSNPNPTPKNNNSNTDSVIDYILDGEYIVGSFYAVYGIDLTTAEIHWHLFKALLISLPDECMIKKIMSYRSYKKNNEKYETQMNNLRSSWKLPSIYEQQQNENKKELMEEINNEFYNS